MKLSAQLLIFLQITSHSFAQNSAGLESNDVIIGTQTWSTVNLATTKFQNGDSLFHAKNTKDWDSAYLNRMPAYILPAFNAENNTYGFLYNEFALFDTRNICPKGYRIPTLNDWNLLFSFLIDSVGHKLKSTDGWDINDRSSNSTGFNAKPGGSVSYKIKPNGAYTSAYFWFLTEDQKTGAIKLLSGYYGYGVPKFLIAGNGFSVRCLKVVE